MALVMVSRTVEFNGNMRTECVKKMNGLLDTEMKKAIIVTIHLKVKKNEFTFLVTFTALQ